MVSLSTLLSILLACVEESKVNTKLLCDDQLA